MELHLFRHGQTDWNAERRVQGQSESQLNDLGVQQAQELSGRINDLRFTHVYCSSSKRTRQTADHAFAHGEFAITYLDSLREICMGPWEGHLYDEISNRDPDSFRHFWHEPHLFDVAGAESFAELQLRAITAIEDIRAQHQGERIALVSHGALIKAVLCQISERPLSDLWAPPAMHNCAHSIIEFSDSGDAVILQYADQTVSDGPG
jgi:broad specificity phosphatase PhoE